MKFEIPEEAVTEGSAVLVWTRIDGAAAYEIEEDGRAVCRTTVTDAKLQDLAPETRYCIRVKALLDDGSTLQTSPEVRLVTKNRKPRIQAADFGLIRDAGDRESVSHNQRALQAAIDACPEGGILVIPEGTFVSGALYLHGNMTLHLSRGAVLKASDDPADFPPYPYRYEGTVQRNFACILNTRPGEHLENLSITGEGTIDANGAVLFAKELAAKDANRSNAVCIQNTDHLYLDGITIREAPFWCLHPIFCRHVTMYGITIDTGRDHDGAPYGLYNGDGIDPDSCRDVRILHSRIQSQDDCIAVKAGRGREGREAGIPSQHIRISDCTFVKGFGVAMGSESSAGIRDVLVQDCSFTDSFGIASVKNRRGRSGYIEDIVYDHCTLVNRNPEYRENRWLRAGISVDQSYGEEQFDALHPEEITDDTPYIGRITFRNICLKTLYAKPVLICGLPERHIGGVTLEDVEAEGTDACVIQNADDVCMRGVRISGSAGEKT